MSAKNAVSARTQRLNKLLVGRIDDSNVGGNKTNALINRETLLDAFDALYNECNKDSLRKHNSNVSDFTKKFRDPLGDVKKLRVNIDDFVVKKLIGKGYFGEVHLVVENITHDVYALKKIPKINFTQSKEERNILAISRSDWIPTLQYAFQDQTHLYLIMEYLPGGDLFSLMVRNNTFPEEVIQFYLAEITLALNALHTLGYVHRDIKPENILLDRLGHLKLADFGSAAAIEKDGYVTSFTPIGTPDYIAPELLQPIHSRRPMRTTYNETCDFWSMGVIAYEMLSETNPFHCDNVDDTYSQIFEYINSDNSQKLQFPNEIDVSDNLRNLIHGLVTKRDNRFNYRKIITHPFFSDIDWMNLRQQVPPIIPTLNGDEDTSNFEEDNRSIGRNNTYDADASTSLKCSSFSGNELPFVGFSYVHDEPLGDGMLVNDSNRAEVSRLTAHIKSLQKTIDTQVVDINSLQQSLSEHKRDSAQSKSVGKILNVTKEEMHTLKEKLKEKTVEIANCRTQIKTLKNSLKIEEEQRAKNDANISDVLNSTYQKWERAKKSSDQNYEKQIAEKNAEIVNIQQKLKLCEKELKLKSSECADLQKTVDDFMDRLKSSKSQNSSEKTEFVKRHRESNVHFEGQLRELRTKLQKQTDAKHLAEDEIQQMKAQIEEINRKMVLIAEQKDKLDLANSDLSKQLNREIDENHNIRDEKYRIAQQMQDLQAKVDEMTSEVRKNRRSIMSPVNSIDGGSSLYCSMESLTSEIENQLKKDLALAKEGEIEQRSRANDLEETVKRLETVIERITKQGLSSVDGFLERKNEKLEETLNSVKEQSIIDRQMRSTACLEQWKSRKELETVQRQKLELEKTVKKTQIERDELERNIKENRIVMRNREERIAELQSDLSALKLEMQSERSRWEKEDDERKKDKTKIINQDTKIYKLEIDLDECRSKMRLFEQQKNALALKNQELTQQLRKEKEELDVAVEKQDEYQQSYETICKNHEMLKKVCSLMETQLNELEGMYNAQLEQNKTKSVTIDKLWEDIRQRDGKLLEVKQELRDEKLQKVDIDQKSADTTNELCKVNAILADCRQQLAHLDRELTAKTEYLMKAEEMVEIQKEEIQNVQRINKTLEHELYIMKEDSSKVRTEWCIQLEENKKIELKYKTLQERYFDMEKEIEQLAGTITELQQYHVQREIKSEATQAQYKKLIDYLQKRCDELSQKKKKTLAGVLFGSNSGASKKENIPPALGVLQEELKREKVRSSQMKLQPVKISKSFNKSNATVKPSTERDQRPSIAESQTNNASVTPAPSTSMVINQSTINEHNSDLHRFERTSHMHGSDMPTQCLVCKKHFLSDSVYQCQKCMACVHQYCRGSNMKCSVGMSGSENGNSIDTPDSVASSTYGAQILEYTGDIVLKETDCSPALNIRCIHEMDDNFLLLGCSTGLKAFNVTTGKVIHVANIDNVISMAIIPTFPKSLLITENGKKLVQCDYRQLQTRTKANVCLNTGLEFIELNSPNNRTDTVYDQWRFVKMFDNIDYTDELSEPIAIAATPSQIVIWRYNVNQKRFRAIKSLDTAEPVQSVHFTSRMTAIVSSNKFFEIDLMSLSRGELEYREFCDDDDSSLDQAHESRPSHCFGVNDNEYLLCFNDFGVFVDEYGRRSRPNDIEWIKHPPTAFAYRAPILYVFSQEGVHMIRIKRTSNDDPEADGEPNDVQKIVQKFIDANQAQYGTTCGKYGIFAITNASGLDGGAVVQHIVRIDGVKALRTVLTDSLETILSSDTEF